MSVQPDEVDRLIREVRATFHRVREVADVLHVETGVTACMRGVLETLAEGGTQTVPAMARAKGVSRQHIQATVDALARAGLVTMAPNPAHRKSPLIQLSAQGEAVFAGIRSREAKVLATLATALPAAEVRAGRAVLAALRAQLQSLPLVTAEGAKPETDP